MRGWEKLCGGWRAVCGCVSRADTCEGKAKGVWGSGGRDKVVAVVQGVFKAV